MCSFAFHSCGLSGSDGAFAVALSSPAGLVFLHKRNSISMYDKGSNSNLY